MESRGRGAAAAAQDGNPLWYESHYTVPWAKIDSLQSLLAADGELAAAAHERGNFLESKILIHHTGDEWNVVFMSKYADWAAIDADPGLNGLAREMWGEERAQARSAAWNWVLGEGAHRDYIYTEAASVP